MKKIKKSLDEMLQQTSPAIRKEVTLEFLISNRICDLMEEQGLSKVQLAKAIEKRPSEITKWLSGQHNFTIRTLALLSSFFDKPLIIVAD